MAGRGVLPAERPKRFWLLGAAAAAVRAVKRANDKFISALIYRVVNH